MSLYRIVYATHSLNGFVLHQNSIEILYLCYSGLLFISILSAKIHTKQNIFAIK